MSFSYFYFSLKSNQLKLSKYALVLRLHSIEAGCQSLKGYTKATLLQYNYYLIRSSDFLSYNTAL